MTKAAVLHPGMLTCRVPCFASMCNPFATRSSGLETFFKSTVELSLNGVDFTTSTPPHSYVSHLHLWIRAIQPQHGPNLGGISVELDLDGGALDMLAARMFLTKRPGPLMLNCAYCL